MLMQVWLLTAVASVLAQPEFDWKLADPPKIRDGSRLLGDVAVTEEQWRLMVERKGISDTAKLWPEDADGYPTLQYRIESDKVSKEVVDKAMRHWEENTCLRFKENLTGTKGVVRMISDDGKCYSYVGYHSTWNQWFSLGSGCNGVGLAVHEIGHAIGFNHEHKRSDRDSYVRVNFGNIKDAYQFAFYKMTTANYDVPYDYTSSMHYRSWTFHKNDRLCIAALDPLDQTLLGAGNLLTHRDKLLANRMYSCIDKWLKACKITEDPCKNEGYTGSDCKCVCRDGTSGEHCENVDNEDYYAAYRKACNKKVTTEGTITSDGYPKKYSWGTCVTVIEAPEGKTVEVKFDTFNVSPNNAETLEIHTDDPYDGPVYSGTDLQGKTITSSNGKMTLVSYCAGRYSEGWSATVTFV